MTYVLRMCLWHQNSKCTRRTDRTVIPDSGLSKGFHSLVRFFQYFPKELKHHIFISIPWKCNVFQLNPGLVLPAAPLQVNDLAQCVCQQITWRTNIVWLMHLGSLHWFCTEGQDDGVIMRMFLPRAVEEWITQSWLHRPEENEPCLPPWSGTS